MYEARVYQGHSVEIVPLDPSGGLSIGEGNGCGYRLPAGSCPGAEVLLFYKRGVWTAECSGNVLHRGKQVRTAQLENGDMLVLSSQNHMAVQLTEREEAPQAAVDLRGLQELLVGRADNCPLQLVHKRVSGSHAKLYRRGEQWRLCDINSTNGTFVNGKQTGECALKAGDQIVIGPYDLIFDGEKLLVYGARGSVRSRLSSAEWTAEKKKTAKKTQKGGTSREYPIFTRSPRLIRQLPQAELEIEAAPQIGQQPQINWLSTLLPSFGGVGLMLVVTVLTGMSPVSLLFSGPMAILGVVVTVINYNRQTKAFLKRDVLRTEKYEQYLTRCEERLKSFADEQRAIACSSSPALAECMEIAGKRSERLWVRTPGDTDFLSLRVGLGDEPLKMNVRTPKLGVLLEEDVFTRRPEALAKEYQRVSGIPVTADLFACQSAGLVGGRGQLLNTVRCMVIQLAALHSYEEVKLAVIFPKEEYGQWEWMRWLPHTFNDSRSFRYMACTSYETSQLLKQLNGECRGRKKEHEDFFGKMESAIPHYVLVVAAPQLIKGGAAGELFETPGVSSIWLAPALSALPQSVEQILELGAGGQIYMRRQASERRAFQPDEISLTDCEAFARSLAPVRLAGGKKAGLPDSVSFLEGYRVSKVDQLDIGDFWQNARCEKTLSVPIGVRENGENYYFDIHETKDGPHGLAAGTSGSGKSEMAQSWIASMSLQFSPEDVNFILVDFKGTSLLQPFKELPHLAGSISNLDTDIGRCLLALESEMERRQRVFDEAGVNNICEYLTKRRKTRNMEKMPFLILVIDEFAEFKAQFPDFTGPLNHVFRGGRSLGVYTVIMTQKPSGVVTDQMNANANFRWCLKVQSESDSRDMLGIPDAAFLTVPGRSYVRSGEGTVELIQPFYSGADYQPGAQKRQIPPVCAVSLLGERTPLGNPHSNQEAPKKKQIDAVVQAISDYCRRMGIAPASQLWTKPLEERLELAKVLPSGRLWEQSSDWKELMEGAQAVFGMVDDPMHQRQVPLCHDFWKQGNLLVYGMTLSGKTTFLKSLLISMCCTYSPAQVQFYLMEFTGFGLRSLETFPHVGGAAGDDEPENLARIGEKLLEELGRRKKLFRKAGVGTISSYEDAAGESLPTIILLADTLNLAGTKFPGLQGQIIQLAREGEAFGLYIAAAVTGGSGLSYQLTENFKTVMTLQLTDRLDYTQLVGRVSGNIPKPVIGRGLVRGPLEFQTAIAGEELTDGQRIAMLRDLAGRMSASWKGPLPDRIRSVPETVPYGSLKGEPLILGVRYGDGETASLPVREATSLLISCGSRESGEEVLALLYRQAREMEDARIYGYGQEMDPPALGEVLGKLAPILQERLNRKEKGEKVEFSHIFIFVDQLADFLAGAEPLVISQLEAFIRLGVGIGVTVVGADLASRVERCYFSRDILMETFHEGPILLTGGEASQHRIIDTIALRQWLPEESLGRDLVLVNRKDGQETFTRIRPMEAVSDEGGSV